MRPPGPTAAVAIWVWCSISSTSAVRLTTSRPDSMNSATSGTDRAAANLARIGMRRTIRDPFLNRTAHLVAATPPSSGHNPQTIGCIIARRSGVRRARSGIFSGGSVGVVAHAGLALRQHATAVAFERGEGAAFVGHDPHVDQGREGGAAGGCPRRTVAGGGGPQ